MIGAGPNMIEKYMNRAIFLIFTVLFLPVSGLYAQKASTSSPYSRYGIGELRGSQLPQTRAMGGIASGVRHIGVFSNINTENPASYSALQFTVIDAGVFGNITQLSNSSRSENSYNFALSHLNLAFPMGRAGGLSAGVRPYSDVGYSYLISESLDTTAINKVYAGEGGTNAAYLGYGVRINQKLSVGVNFNYLFGKLTQVRSVEFPGQTGALNSREDQDNFVNGFSIGYGAQYFQPVGRYILVLGYSGSAGSRLNSRQDILTIRTPSSVSNGTDNLPVDTISYFEGQKEKITMPFRHSIGFTLTNSNKWMVGADLNYETWSDFSQGGVSQGLRDSYGVAIGGQLTPDPTAVNYFGVVDYRLGFRYNKTYIHVNNEGVDQMAVTIGLGLPLPSLFGLSYNKVNIAAEIGQMGRVSNHLVRERFVNFSLGFTLNDSWFRRPTYD